MSPLSKYQISAGRRLYGIFSALNSASFTLVTGNIIVVYAMYLKAGSVTIGLITAFNFLSFFALPLGKMFVRHRPIMRVYASSWVARNASLLVMLPIPFFVKAGMAQWALPCVLLACFGFNFFRGIGMVANNPVISDLAPGKDRGSFLVFLSVTNNTAALITTLLLAFALRFGNSLVVLNAAVITGIVLGFVSSFLLYKMPSSDRVAHGTSSSFYEHFIKAVHDRNFRIFIAAFWVVGLAVGMSRPFIIVYCREVYEQPDSIYHIRCAVHGAYVPRVYRQNRRKAYVFDFYRSVIFKPYSGCRFSGICFGFTGVFVFKHDFFCFEFGIFR